MRSDLVKRGVIIASVIGAVLWVSYFIFVLVDMNRSTPSDVNDCQEVPCKEAPTKPLPLCVRSRSRDGSDGPDHAKVSVALVEEHLEHPPTRYQRAISMNPKSVAWAQDRVRDLEEVWKITLTTLEEFGVECYAIEGPLFALLRVGMFSYELPDFGPLETDTDVDLMLRVKDQEELKTVMAEVYRRIKKKYGGKFKYGRGEVLSMCQRQLKRARKPAAVVNSARLAQWTLHLDKPGMFKVDIASFILDEKNNMARSQVNDPKFASCFPWGPKHGGASTKYRGHFVDPDGKPSWGIFEFRDHSFKMKVRVPWNYNMHLKQWNDGEYGSGNFEFPVGGSYWWSGKWKYFSGKLTKVLSPNDRLALRRRCIVVKELGYSTFPCDKMLFKGDFKHLEMKDNSSYEIEKKSMFETDLYDMTMVKLQPREAFRQSEEDSKDYDTMLVVVKGWSYGKFGNEDTPKVLKPGVSVRIPSGHRFEIINDSTRPLKLTMTRHFVN